MWIIDKYKAYKKHRERIKARESVIMIIQKMKDLVRYDRVSFDIKDAYVFIGKELARKFYDDENNIIMDNLSHFLYGCWLYINFTRGAMRYLSGVDKNGMLRLSEDDPIGFCIEGEQQKVLFVGTKKGDEITIEPYKKRNNEGVTHRSRQYRGKAYKKDVQEAKTPDAGQADNK